MQRDELTHRQFTFSTWAWF